MACAVNVRVFMNNIAIRNSYAARRIMLNVFRNILRIAIAHSGGVGGSLAA